jgi:hypothetical protein
MKAKHSWRADDQGLPEIDRVETRSAVERTSLTVSTLTSTRPHATTTLGICWSVGSSTAALSQHPQTITRKAICRTVLDECGNETNSVKTVTPSPVNVQATAMVARGICTRRRSATATA